jgi:hypothetical protein
VTSGVIFHSPGGLPPNNGEVLNPSGVAGALVNGLATGVLVGISQLLLLRIVGLATCAGTITAPGAMRSALIGLRAIMSAVGRSLSVDADGPSPREESVGDFTELPAALLLIGQPDPLVVPLLHRPHVADMLGGAHLVREVLADEGLGLRSPDRT